MNSENAEQSILKHIGLAGVLKGYGIYDNVITAMEDYAKERVKNAEQSILKHIGLAGVLKGYEIYDNVITAMEDYAFTASGRR